MKPTALLFAVLGVFPALACSASAQSAAQDVVLPTRYIADRFYAAPVTTRGDTVLLYLDTGGGTLMWDVTLPRLGIAPVDSVAIARGGFVRLVDLPPFRSERTVPPAITKTSTGTRLQVRATGSGFESYIVKSSDGQLGTNWFGDRVWTLDYKARRVTLHASPSNMRPGAAHVTPLGFRTDSTGRRLSHSPNVAVEIGGDTLIMIIDTGAAMWLAPEALTAVGDKGKSEHAISLVRADIFTAWRSKHPDWRVIEHADLLTQGAIIQVPHVTVAGHTVGPVWFMSYGPAGGGGAPQTPPANAPKAPPLEWRFDGTVGGSFLKYFAITLDYPRALAEFRR